MSIECRQQATDADVMENEAVTGYSNDSMEHNDVRYGWQNELWYVKNWQGNYYQVHVSQPGCQALQHA
jgi:hypothetical protein